MAFGLASPRFKMQNFPLPAYLSSSTFRVQGRVFPRFVSARRVFHRRAALRRPARATRKTQVSLRLRLRPETRQTWSTSAKASLGGRPAHRCPVPARSKRPASRPSSPSPSLPVPSRWTASRSPRSKSASAASPDDDRPKADRSPSFPPSITPYDLHDLSDVSSSSLAFL